jgi:general secretion pathway protein D
MKMPKLPKSVALTLATPALISLVVPAASLLAQGQTDTKIRLMSDALRARDAGDLDTAKKNLEELLDIAPNDATVQRLLSGVNNSIASRPAAPAPDVTTPVPEVTAPSPAPAPAVIAEKPIASEPKEVSYPPKPAPKAAPAKTPEQLAADEAEQINKQENQRIKGLLAETKANRAQARKFANEGRFDDATAEIDKAIASLPVNSTTSSTIDDLHAEKSALLMGKVQAALQQGDTEGARVALESYTASTSDTKKVDKLANDITNDELNPRLQPAEKVSPSFIKDQKEIAKLASKGRSQYLAGDIDGAQESFRLVETIDSNSPVAKDFLTRIANDKARIGELNQVKARSQMMEEVANAWQRPGIYVDRERSTSTPAVAQALVQKLNSIQIPSVNFQSVELSKVVSTLSAISEEYDKSEGQKGVNIVLLDPSNKNPTVSITLRNLPLKRILDLIADSTGYQYETQADTVVVRPGGDNSMLESAFFSVTKATVIRMTGMGASGGASAPAAGAADPFAAPAAGAAASGGGTSGGESSAIQNFLEQAGVKFSTTPGSSLVYDGSAILVNQSSHNIDKIRNILNRYDNVKQVEIEAKFMDVAQGALDEMGVNWGAVSTSGTAVVLGSQNRTLSNAFNTSTPNPPGSIVRPGVDPISVSNEPSKLPGAGNLGAELGSAAAIAGRTIGDFDVSATLRALSNRTGSELLSAPKVTVLSGTPANIIVGQEMRYPQSFGETKSDVGTGGGNGNNNGGGGGGGVTITAGTPQEFTMRTVGVELKVTPNVEEDDYSITLDMSPKVTEFDGFVEYGGSSVAISSGGTVVTLPSGFYQPIFSVREITSKVTVWDGATIVMGGLTREEIKRVNDKVPFLGDIPFLGAAFRSKGESSTKRNLLVFVTANLVSPGGSYKKQSMRGIPAGSTFQNPTVVSPSSAESRNRVN